MSAPTAPLIKMNNRVFPSSIRFYWAPPVSSGDSPISSYTLTCSSISFQQSFPFSTYNFTPNFLPPSSNLIFQVFATNSNGLQGAPATYIPYQTGLKPLSPTNISISTVSSNACVITWSPPTSDGGSAITKYGVWTYPVDANSNILSNVSSLVVQKYVYGNQYSRLLYFNNILSNYKLNVFALNSVGPSPDRASDYISFAFVQPFSPSSLSGMSLWLDASQLNSLTLSGSSVVRWNDKLSSRYLSSPSLSEAPILSNFNSISSIYFDGTNDYIIGNFNFSAVTTASFKTMFVVGLANTADTNDGRPYWNDSFIGDAGGYIGLYVTSAGKIGSYNWPTGINNTEMSYTFSNLGIIGYQHNNTTLGINFNGNFPSTTGTSATGDINGTFWLGRTYNTASYLNGHIMETLVYNNSLTPFDRQKVEGYLAWKWGIQSNLPSSHPFYLSRPTTTSVFSPGSFSGLQLWLDASDSSSITLTNTSVTSWADKSGNSRNASSYQISNPLYSSNAFNSRPCIQFNTNDALRSSAAPGTFTNGVTCFVVFQKTGSRTPIDGLISRTIAGNPDPFDVYNSWRFMGTGGTNNNNSGAADLGNIINPTIYCFNVSSNGWIENFNGSNTTSLIGPFTYGDAASFIYLGTRADNATSFRGNISEIIMYNRILFNQDRQTVEGYLAWKWGLQDSLPLTHPYKFFNPSFNNTSSLVTQGLLIRFDATSYSGSGNWSNTGSLGTNFNAFKVFGSIAKNTAGNGIVLDGSTSWGFSNIGLQTSFTLSVWFKRTGTPNTDFATIVTDGHNGSAGINMAFLARNNSISIGSNQTAGGFYDISTAWKLGNIITLNLNSWSNLTVTFDNSTKFLNTFVNGVVTNSTQYSGLTPATGNLMYRIGSTWDNQGRFVVGEIGQILIYNRAINATEVLQNYIATSNTFSV